MLYLLHTGNWMQLVQDELIADNTSTADDELQQLVDINPFIWEFLDS